MQVGCKPRIGMGRAVKTIYIFKNLKVSQDKHVTRFVTAVSDVGSIDLDRVSVQINQNFYLSPALQNHILSDGAVHV